MKQTESRTRQRLDAAGENNSLKVKNEECVILCRLACLIHSSYSGDQKQKEVLNC